MGSLRMAAFLQNCLPVILLALRYQIQPNLSRCNREPFVRLSPSDDPTAALFLSSCIQPSLLSRQHRYGKIHRYIHFLYSASFVPVCEVTHSLAGVTSGYLSLQLHVSGDIL